MSHHRAGEHGHDTPAMVEHRAHAPRTVRFAIVTASDTRTSTETDEGGHLASALLRDAGHSVSARVFARDTIADITAAVTELLARDDTDAVIITGGTGVSARDVTPEAVRPLLEKELPGFGEIFRMLSFEEIGAAAYLSRALCGIAQGKPLWALPGSPAGVAVAVERLIAPEAGHLVSVAARGRA